MLSLFQIPVLFFVCGVSVPASQRRLHYQLHFCFFFLYPNLVVAILIV